MSSGIKSIHLHEIFNKSNIVKFSLRALLILLPFLCVFLISFCFGYKGTFKILVPAWNDEVGWYNQVEAILQYGRPLGYWGYNESFAQIGTFGPWGIAPLLPYALFGKIFGWQLNSMAIANISFLSFSLFLFTLMTKPSNRQVIYLITAYLSLYIVIGYSLTSMSEGLRYSCAIVLTGFIIWVERCTGNDSSAMTVKQKILFIVGCIYILYCVQVYLIFCLAVFIVPLLILRKTKVKLVLRVIISASITLAIAVLSQKLIDMVTCPYFQPSTIEIIFDQITTNGLYKGLCFTLNNFFNNLSTVNLPKLITFTGSGGILIWYFISYLILLFSLVIRFIYTLISNKPTDIKSRENVFTILALYFLAGFLIGYCMLYTGSNWTLCRGTNTGLIMAMLFLIFGKKEKYTCTYALITVFAIVAVWTHLGNIINERNSLSQYEEQIYKEKEKLSEIIDISPKLGEWENTVACYGNMDFWILSLPAGAGNNGIYNEQVCEKSKYAVMPAGDATEEQQSIFEEKGYVLIYTDDIFAVFEKTAV